MSKYIVIVQVTLPDITADSEDEAMEAGIEYVISGEAFSDDHVEVVVLKVIEDR